MSNSGRIVRVLAAALAFSAMASANAATIQLRAWLNGAQEVPPVATAATGLATVTYNTVTGELTWNVSYSGLSSAINGAHFHGPTPAGIDAGITVPMTAGPTSPIIGSATISATQAAQLLSGQWYVNIHSANFGGGEIRGQVLPVRGDFNGDGKADILWRNTDGHNYIYFMDGTTVLGTSGYTNTVPSIWTLAATADFNGDGKADILWRNTDGHNYIYFMDGTTVLGTSDYTQTVPLIWTLAGTADFNGDGKADILWRNTSTGENYIYLMDGTTVLGTSGYTNTVPSIWTLAATADFNGDGKADILWRNTDGHNYIYFMDGTTVLGTSGYTNTVPSIWTLAATADFNGDGKADILWRNTAGHNYIYFMDGTTVLGTSDYTQTVPLIWTLAGTADFNGDGKADILWRNISGHNYIYFMDGTTVLGTSNYTNTVPLVWTIAGTPLPTAQTIAGLEFPSNISSGPNNNSSVRFRFTGAALIPIYGTSGSGVTYLWKYRPRQQTGFYTCFFWGNDDDNGSPTTFGWKNGNPDSYYGAHPFPANHTGFDTNHLWEVSVENADFTDTESVVKDVWYSQAFRAWGANGAVKNHEYYWNLPNTTTALVTHATASSYGNTNPPAPALTWGDAPWNPSQERLSGVLRGLQIFNALLDTTQINTLAACETDACVLSTANSLGVLGGLWYLNMNPANASDISDKSGAGHHPAWWNANRPTHWAE